LERSNTAALDPLYDSRIERKSLRKKRKVGKKNTAALDPHQNCHKSDLGLKKGNTATINPLYDSRKLVFERSRENTATIYPLNDSRILKNGREAKRRSKSEKRGRIRLPTTPDGYTVLGPTAYVLRNGKRKTEKTAEEHPLENSRNNRKKKKKEEEKKVRYGR